MPSEITDFEAYRQSKLAKERVLLPFANQFRPLEQYYGINGFEVAVFALPYIREKLGGSRTVTVLEIGGGQGKAIEYLLKQLEGELINYTLTSLNPLPEHDLLVERGVKVLTGVIVEELPAGWSGVFDAVMTQRLLGWTEMQYSIPQIKRVLAQNGVWCGYESADATLKTGSRLVGTEAEYWMIKNGMGNEMLGLQVNRCLEDKEFYPLIWTKK